MRIVTSVIGMQHLAQQWRRCGVLVGCVPTMGCLHDGHLSLMRHARRRVGQAGKVVVTIYVNPTQFGLQEDLSRYPRDLKRDFKLCRAEGADVVFTPSDAEMYPGKSEGRYSTYVVEEKLSPGMEGVSRPIHFRGVTTVVVKLFNIVLPSVAVFGAKDWQQAAIVKRMVSDLNFALKIVVAATIRERDGLALSSRNRYLDPEQRAQATILHGAIQYARAAVKGQPASVPKLKAELRKFIATAPLAGLDYLEFFDPKTMSPVTKVSRGTHMALAVFVGNTRLIDNLTL